MKSTEYFFKRKWEEHNEKEALGDKSREKEEEPKESKVIGDAEEVVDQRVAHQNKRWLLR